MKTGDPHKHAHQCMYSNTTQPVKTAESKFYTMSTLTDCCYYLKIFRILHEKSGGEKFRE